MRRGTLGTLELTPLWKLSCYGIQASVIFLLGAGAFLIPVLMPTVSQQVPLMLVRQAVCLLITHEPQPRPVKTIDKSLRGLFLKKERGGGAVGRLTEQFEFSLQEGKPFQNPKSARHGYSFALLLNLIPRWMVALDPRFLSSKLGPNVPSYVLLLAVLKCLMPHLHAHSSSWPTSTLSASR